MTIHCLVCKKVIKGKPAMVLLSTDARVWSEAKAPTDLGDRDQGLFEVGPECHRKIRATGRAGMAL